QIKHFEVPTRAFPMTFPQQFSPSHPAGRVFYSFILAGFVSYTEAVQASPPKSTAPAPGLGLIAWLMFATVLLSQPPRSTAAPSIDTDICVYGGTSGGVIAAVEAARNGRSVALVAVNNHLGGM